MGNAQNLKLGRQGESIAKKYLASKGYRIIEENHRTKYAEIDIIAKRKNILVFVEVRTRQDERFGLPEESLNKEKLRRLERAAEAYISLKNYRGAYRLDAVCIVWDKETDNLKRIDHYEIK